jgi:hypothetical protein
VTSRTGTADDATGAWLALAAIYLLRPPWAVALAQGEQSGGFWNGVGSGTKGWADERRDTAQ